MFSFVKNRYFVFCYVFITLSASNAQKANDANNNLINQYNSYFSTPRKSIHLHLNKTVFISGEQIGFTTYMFDKKENAISLEEEYININLINNLGEVLSSKTVLYSQNNGFNNILLEPELPSGEYFLQAYTNTMQRYVEDDSASYKIKVFNFEDDISSINIENEALEEIRLEIQAESGQLLKDILGTCAIRITDTNNNPVIPDKVLLTSLASSKNSNIPINELGTGRFSLIPSKNKQYQIEAYIGDKVYKKAVPLANNSGYTISANYNYGKDLLLVSINTNEESLAQNLSLLVHKDGNLLSIPVSFDKNKNNAEIVFPFSKLFKGVNTLSLVLNGKVLAERLVFAYPENSTLSAQLLNIEQQKDSIVVFLKNNMKNVQSLTNRMSVSVLPKNSLSNIAYQNLPSSFFLKGNIPNETISQLQKIPFMQKDAAKYLLDNVLILQGWGRYKWKNISNPNFIFPNNATNLSQIFGYVNLFDTKNDSLTVMLYSKNNGLFETTLLNDEKKFRFNNLILAKDSKFSLTLMNKGGKSVYANFFFTTIPQKQRYRHSFKPKSKNRTPQKSNITPNSDANPFLKKVEKLEGVTVTADKLKYEKLFAGYYGRKVDSTLRYIPTLETYIKSQGFIPKFINPQHADPRIAGTTQFVKFCGGREFISPYLVIDGVFHPLPYNVTSISMEHIDEIYYKKPSGVCAIPTFVIITNDKYGNRPVPESKKNAKEFIVENGYDSVAPFVRPEYHSTTSRSFENYGIISWLPKLISNDQGVISFKIPTDGQQKLKLQLQGFAENGDLIYDSLLVDLSKGK